MVITVAFVLGLLCGSFTNVLVARIPAGEEWVRTPSHCPECRAELAWYDNIPVLSWLWLRRRCRSCHRPISARYPLVELLVAVLFATVAAKFGVSVLAFAMAYLAVISVALAAIDLEYMRLPNALTLPAYPVLVVFIVIEAWVTGEWWMVVRALIGAMSLGAFYLLFWLIYPKGMGFGDVKTAGMLGLMLGAVSWSALVVGAISGPLIGGVVGVVVIVRTRKARGVRIPYGPWLLAGAWLGILAGDWIGSSYLSLTVGT